MSCILPKVTLLSNMYNEEYLLPFWCKHHKDMFDHAVIVDYGCTDKSIDIIKDICPNWEVRKSKNTSFGAIEIDNEFNDIEPEFDGFKIVLNTTEFLICDQPLNMYLSNFNLNECLEIQTISPYSGITYNPENLDELLNGFERYSDDRYFRSPRYIHSYTSCKYGLGRHTVKIPYKNSNNLLIVWMGFYPWNQNIIKRRLQCKQNIPESDIQKGYSYHHFWTEDKMNEERKKLLLYSKDIKEHQLYQRIKFY